MPSNSSSSPSTRCRWWLFCYGYVQDSLKPVDASSKDYVTVQIPDGANVQEIGSTLEKSGLVKHGLIFSFMLSTIAMPT